MINSTPIKTDSPTIPSHIRTMGNNNKYGALRIRRIINLETEISALFRKKKNFPKKTKTSVITKPDKATGESSNKEAFSAPFTSKQHNASDMKTLYINIVSIVPINCDKDRKAAISTHTFLLRF